jgi:hypothetical protein
MNDLTPHANDWSLFYELRLPHMTVHRYQALTDDIVQDFLADLDVIYLVETDYDPQRPSQKPLFKMAREAGVKTVLHINPELCRWAQDPEWAAPDVFAAPTPWLAGTLLAGLPNLVLLPMPVSFGGMEAPLQEIRTNAFTFLHNAGWPAMQDRAGTQTVVDAIQFINSPVRIRIRAHQPPAQPHHLPSHIKLGIENVVCRHWSEAYWPADVLLAPRAYGGLSLPLLEAYACGIPAVTLNREPENAMVPESCLLPVTMHREVKMQGGWVNVEMTTPKHIADKVDELANDPGLVRSLSETALDWAKRNSWEQLLPRWMEVLAP